MNIVVGQFKNEVQGTTYTEHPILKHPNFPYLAVKLYEQQTDYSCGPASLLIAMSHFGPKPLTESQLRVECRTQGDGTSNYNMIQVAKAHGFQVKSGAHGTPVTLRNFLRKGWPVIVDYKDSPTSYHFSVVVSCPELSNVIVLADPWYRAFVQWPLREFQDAWDECEGGYIAIAPKGMGQFKSLMSEK